MICDRCGGEGIEPNIGGLCSVCGGSGVRRGRAPKYEDRRDGLHCWSGFEIAFCGPANDMECPPIIRQKIKVK